MTEITEAVEALTALVGEPAAHWSISGEPGDECVDVPVADIRALLSELTRLQAEVEGLRDVLRPILRLRIAIAGAITEEPGAHRIRLEDGSFVEGPAADWLLETSKTFLAVTDAVQLTLQGQQS